jgi:hypothetical protein
MDSFDDYIYIKHKIESLLITQVADFLEEEAVKPIAEEWILIHLLLKEKQGMNNNVRNYDTALKKYKSNPGPSLLIDMKLKDSTLRVRGLLEKNKGCPGFLKKHITKVLEEQLDYNIFCVEEG